MDGMKYFNSSVRILRITMKILHILGKRCQFEREFNNIIMAMDPYLQNHYISNLMLYFHIYVGLIQTNIYYYTLKDYGYKEEIY